MSEKPGTVVIVGATSSLAQALCQILARVRYDLVLIARDRVELDMLAGDIATRHNVAVRSVVADFTDTQFSAELLVQQAGEFHHMIIATGDMGASDPTGIANLAYTMQLNYTAPAQLATAAALYLSAAKEEGSITLICSVAGDRGRQSNYAYGSAKAALATFASGLRNRFCKQGVHVMTVKPGFIDTPMTWGMDSMLIASRELVAEEIVDAMQAQKNIVYVPFFWRYIMLIIIHIPETIFKKLKL